MVKDFLSGIYGAPRKIKSKNLLMLRKRDVQRAINPFKRIREPVPPKRRKEVLKIARNKCQYPGCTIREEGDIKLQIHHKNMKNDDNKISNLIALCATHHGAKHRQEKRIVKKDSLGIREIRSKVVSKEKAKQMKKKAKQNPYALPFRI